MLTNKEFRDKLRASQAVFHLTDLHVHSPASADIGSGARLEALPEDLRSLVESIPKSLSSEPVEYEKAAIEKVPPSKYLEALVKRRDEVNVGAASGRDTDWAIVAITDHNVCGYSTAIASLAFEQRAANQLLVLPGIELDIEYPCDGPAKKATIHVLCLFAIGVAESDVRIAIREAGSKSWAFGQHAVVESLPKFIEGLRGHATYPAICIAAHVSSSKGVHKETHKTILGSLEAELSRISGEIQRIDEENTPTKKREKKELEERLGELEKKRAEGGVALDVLRLIGQCGFDALQVGKPSDEAHYRRLHRFRESHGRAVPILCSDAHRPQDVFGTPSGMPYLKLPGLSGASTHQGVFTAIQKALRYGETRFSAAPEIRPQYWISGVEIRPDAANAAKFWPVPGAKPLPESGKSFVLPFSRNLNTLIGGRGSGKSAAVEAIAFVTRPDDFKGMTTLKKERPDYYNRADATLAGCVVKVCWQFTGNGQAANLPKKAMFAQRFFVSTGDHGAVEYTDAQGKGLVPNQIPATPLQIFRLGDIERQAEPDTLRRLFDQICGTEIAAHAERIGRLKVSLASQRLEMIKIVRRVRELTADESPLRRYVARRKLFMAVDTLEMQNAYDELDALDAAQQTAIAAASTWNGSASSDQFDTLKRGVQHAIDTITASTLATDGGRKDHLDSLAALFEPSAGEVAPPAALSLMKGVAANELLAIEVDQSISSFSAQLSRNIADAKDVLAKKNLPTGSSDREAKKNAFIEAEAALVKYQAAVREWSTALVARDRYRNDLVAECASRSALRKRTAESITAALGKDIDPTILVIKADAQSAADSREFMEWMLINFADGTFKHQKDRIQALLEIGLTPDLLKASLLGSALRGYSCLLVERESAKDGNIDEPVAKLLLERCMAINKLRPEVEEADVTSDVWSKVPTEVREGLLTFPGEAKLDRTDRALALDEIVSDDIPVIRLNDRPLDTGATARPIDELSPGQRCSAVLPILLLTGEGPLVIDQPEDNLDNRLIRQVIVNILSGIKLKRQVILATHNPNIPVLGDVENAVVLQGVGDRQCKVEAAGDLDSAALARHLTDVMEGGREAFQYRHAIYNEHWKGPVEESE